MPTCDAVFSLMNTPTTVVVVVEVVVVVQYYDPTACVPGACTSDRCNWSTCITIGVHYYNNTLDWSMC